MKAFAIFLVATLLVQTQVTEATFFLDFFEKWHPYFQQQQQAVGAPTPYAQVPVPPPTPTAPPPPPARATANATAGAAQFPNIAAAAIATPQLSTLVEIASAVGLAETLADPNLVATVFAPTNAAFAAFFQAYNLTVDQVAAQPDLARLLLSYHLVPGVAATAASLTNGQKLTTQDQGQTITVIKQGNNVSLKPTGQNAPSARVVQADVEAGKAIIHLVDQVLIPENFPLTRGGGGAAANATSAATVAPAAGTNGGTAAAFAPGTTTPATGIPRAMDTVEEGTGFDMPDITTAAGGGSGGTTVAVGNGGGKK